MLNSRRPCILSTMSVTVPNSISEPFNDVEDRTGFLADQEGIDRIVTQSAVNRIVKPLNLLLAIGCGH